MILVDTSVWIDHFRKSSRQLRELLEENQVLIHPFKSEGRGGICFGLTTENRAYTNIVCSLHLIDAHRLHGRGLGWIDVHLLASALLTGCDLWTHDKTLRAIANTLDILG